MIKAGIVGGGGNTGENLLKCLLNHEKVEIRIITSASYADKKVSAVYPGIDCDLRFSGLDVDELNRMDVVFLAVPHGTAQPLARQMTTRIIDLSADHRLTHPYGLPEIFGKQFRNAALIANPGCYATAAILATYPVRTLMQRVIFDCISGYSGAGKAADPAQYQENIIAYKISNHFHIREIEQVLGQAVSFTPHVIQAYRGIMCTAHVVLKQGITAKELQMKYQRFYAHSFTRIVKGIPQTRDVTGSPYCYIGGLEIDAHDRLVIIAVLDNLLKGAASQALENMNIMFGLDHKEGLI